MKKQESPGFSRGEHVKRLPADVWQAVYDREGGSCLRCGKRGEEIHHRRGRGMGGTSVWAHNMARLCLLCRGCHQWAESERAAAYAAGWAIRRAEADDDEQIPLVTLANDRLFLTDDGGVIRAGKDVPF